MPTLLTRVFHGALQLHFNFPTIQVMYAKITPTMEETAMSNSTSNDNAGRTPGVISSTTTQDAVKAEWKDTQDQFILGQDDREMQGQEEQQESEALNSQTKKAGQHGDKPRSESQGNSFKSLFQVEVPKLEAGTWLSLDTAQRSRIALNGVRNNANYSALMEARVLGLERQIKMLGNVENTEDDSWSKVLKHHKEKPRKAAIPKLNWISWDQMKENPRSQKRTAENWEYIPTTEHHAIDVLLGEPRTFHDLHAESRTTIEADTLSANLEGDLPDEVGRKRELPERIRINSLPLIHILKNMQDLETKDEPWIMRKPFRMLQYHENTIKDAIEKLATQLAKSPPARSQAILNPDTTLRETDVEAIVKDSQDVQSETKQVDSPEPRRTARRLT